MRTGSGQGKSRSRLGVAGPVAFGLIATWMLWRRVAGAFAVGMVAGGAVGYRFKVASRSIVQAAVVAKVAPNAIRAIVRRVSRPTWKLRRWSIAASSNLSGAAAELGTRKVVAARDDVFTSSGGGAPIMGSL